MSSGGGGGSGFASACLSSGFGGSGSGGGGGGSAAAFGVGTLVADMKTDDIFKGFPGSLFVVLLGVTFLFHLYLHYSVLGTIYGAIASLIFGFIWLSASVSSLLLGAALATEWAHAWGEDEPQEAGA